MIWHVKRNSARRARRFGLTMIELVASLAAASLLMAGLASSLLIATRTFESNASTMERSRAADVQRDMVIDLQQATQFQQRTTTDVTFSTPDRDGDDQSETLQYSWTGAPNYELTYSENGSSPVTLLEGVKDFNLSFLSRTMSGETAALSPIDKDSWGTRWASDGTFGYTEVFAYNGYVEGRSIATRVTLDNDATAVSINAYFNVVPGGGSPIRMAIFGADNNLNPDNLIIETSVVEVETTGWFSVPIASTPLVAGEYYLALCVKKTGDVRYVYDASGVETHFSYFDARKHGFLDPWGSSYSETTDRISIYVGTE